MMAALHLFQVHIPGTRFRIDQHRRRPAVSHGVDRGDHGEGGQDHFVAGPQTQGGEGQVQGYRTIGAGHAILSAAFGSELVLEVADEGTGG